MLKDKYGIVSRLVQIWNKHTQYSQNKDVAPRVMFKFSSGGFCGDTKSFNCSFVNTTIGPFFFISLATPEIHPLLESNTIVLTIHDHTLSRTSMNPHHRSCHNYRTPVALGRTWEDALLINTMVSKEPVATQSSILPEGSVLWIDQHGSLVIKPHPLQHPIVHILPILMTCFSPLWKNGSSW